MIDRVTSAEAREALARALSPVVDGRRIIGAKLYYLFTTDGHSLDVGVLSIAPSGAALDALSTLIREEAELSKLPQGEHYSTFLYSQPTRH